MTESSSGSVSPKNSLSRVPTSESNSAPEEPTPYVEEDEKPPNNVGLRRGSRRLSVVSSIAPDVEEETKEPFLKSAWDVARPGWLLDHLDFAGFKVIVRTWILVWVGFVLGDIPSSSNWLGTAAYLTSIIGFVLAPGGQPYIMATIISLACLIFVLIGWTHGIIASAITTSIRGNPTSTDIAKQLVEAGICQNNADLVKCVTLQVFSGYFLEFRCTVIFILALMSGITILSMFRRLSPVLIVAHVTGCIATIINCVYGVVVPYFSGTSIGVSILVL
jgi:hypothetical protein